MKKQLLLGSALLAAVSAFPQSGRIKNVSYAPFNMASRLADKYRIENTAVENAPSANTVKQPIGPNMPAQRSAAATTWYPWTGSMNVYGMLVSNSKPLNYHPQLDAVSFVHRKSFTYQGSPAQTTSGAVSGIMVADINRNPQSPATSHILDSTCIWNDANNWGRYPQGGIYNPQGNTNLSNAYVVGMGPITQANSSLGWIGNFFASKPLTAFNNTASSTPNAQQFIANSAPFGAVGKADFVRTDFAATTDGAIRGAGGIYGNANGGSFAAQLYRGIRIVKGTFNSGTFTWSGDSIIPSVVQNSGGYGMMLSGNHMCWSEDGTIGYAWVLGCRSGATGVNSGCQPIVYKTTNSGNTWTQLPGINFTLPGFEAPVLDHIYSVNNDTTLAIPFFNTGEGVDGIVDANGQLHIVTTLISTYSQDSDSLFYSYNFTNADGEKYNYMHRPGMRPYIYDFYTSATTNTSTGSWNVMVIDSMSSEGPGETTTAPGYGSNPWDAAGGSSGTDKVSSDARIQLSRTADGKYILYTWAESDTNFTASSQKWNNIPNVKVRMYDVMNNQLSPTELNATNPSSGANILVASNAQMHYTSPHCVVTGTTGTSVSIMLPMTVSNNQSVPLAQLSPVVHYYASNDLTFSRPSTIGLAENALSSVNNSVVYPNPASGTAVVRINLKDNSSVNIQVINLVGSVVKNVSADAAAGENDINLDLSGLNRGIYMVNVKVGTTTSTKKLVVE